MNERAWWVWRRGTPKPGGDSRKLVTLVQDDMTWVGIRAFHSVTGEWFNNNEPERATVVAWMDLPAPHQSYHGAALPDIEQGCGDCEMRTLEYAKVPGYLYCTRCGKGSIPEVGAALPEDRTP